jgi:outer membrane protein assembly factor BamB
MSRIKIKTLAIAASQQVCLLSIMLLLVAGVCLGKAAVSLSRKSGPPTSKLLVSGSGFKPAAEIVIYFDTKDEAKAIANGSGSFFNIGIEAPTSALPGKHWVSAVQRPGDMGAQAPFLVNTNWSQFHFTPNHEGLNPYENVLNRHTVGSLGLLWTYTTGGPVQSPPIVANGVVYVGSNDGNVYALKASTGTLLWSFPTRETYPISPVLAVSNGAIYVGSNPSGFAPYPFYALQASTGAVLWSYDTVAGVSSPPTIVNGVVYIGGFDWVYALNASDGNEVWRGETDYNIASSMAFAEGALYYSRNGGVLGPEYSSPAVANGVVYFATDMFSLNASDGTRGCYVDFNGIAAVNAITCDVLWNYTAGGTVTYSSPAIVNGVVYFGSDGGNVYALNASNGALLWRYANSGAVQSSPAVANGVVYIGSDDNNLYALNASTGALLWNYTTGGSVESSPAVANGVVYVGSDDGNVYAFGPDRRCRNKRYFGKARGSFQFSRLVQCTDFNVPPPEPIAKPADQ